MFWSRNPSPAGSLNQLGLEFYYNHCKRSVGEASEGGMEHEMHPSTSDHHPAQSQVHPPCCPVCERCPFSPTIPEWFCSTSHSPNVTTGPPIPVTVDSQHPLLRKEAAIILGPLLWKIYICASRIWVLGPQVHSLCLKKKKKTYFPCHQ